MRSDVRQEWSDGSTENRPWRRLHHVKKSDFFRWLYNGIYELNHFPHFWSPTLSWWLADCIDGGNLIFNESHRCKVNLSLSRRCGDVDYFSDGILSAFVCWHCFLANENGSPSIYCRSLASHRIRSCWLLLIVVFRFLGIAIHHCWLGAADSIFDAIICVVDVGDIIEEKSHAIGVGGASRQLCRHYSGFFT